MPTVLAAAQLPRLVSSRDTRDRVDLVTEETFGLTALKADRITYHPGDTAAAHYHEDAKHFFFMLEGTGEMWVDGEQFTLSAGDVALVDAGEVHHFANPGDEDFTFIELWVPTPSATVWVTDDQ
jgi:mannose-6-phosphate isomerase-like protein (cupin superfamily)